MQSIVTISINPAIDKSSSVAHVFAERKLYCKPPRFEPGGGGFELNKLKTIILHELNNNLPGFVNSCSEK
jgi:fructose-1-phosphate kinase PfkB-like protein